jgi:hypothetical protein
MKKLLLTVFLFTLCFATWAQDRHYIGKTVDEVKSMMQQSGTDFFFSKEVETGKHHFLKFENVDQTKTMLFIMSDDGKCEYTKLMCDYSLLKEMEDSLNKNYQYQKNMTWRDYSRDEKYEYLIELIKREWFFTIKTTRVQN